MGKVLKELIERLGEKNVEGSQEIEVRGVACDSRKVEDGFLFVCIPGFNFDGHAFIPEAIKKGACALVVEKDVQQREDMTVIKVPDARFTLGMLANIFYGCPSNKLRVIGIAGTNGKTTITYLVRQILIEAGKKAALLGTISYQLGDKVLPAPWTTPPSLELQSMFKELVEDGFDSVVMEVTSHALTLGRVIGCEFDVGVFNNLSIDHLDFHKTMEDYLEAEAKLFRLLNHSSKTHKKAIINIDDPYAEHIIKNTTVEILTFGINQETCLHANTHRQVDIRAYDISSSLEGLKFNVATPVGKTTINLQLPGRHNVYNALAAIGVGVSEGISLNEIKEALAKAGNVPGRFERIDCGQPFNIVVDYAHTPDALEKVLETARELAKAKVIVVFGCGGERDRTKRPLMGEVAARMSDVVIFTSDNPRGEDPLEIIKEIEAGINPVFSCCEASLRNKKGQDCDYLIIEDRFEAIKKALSLARGGDLVLIAGKGHENYQIVKDKKMFFNDKDVVKGLLEEKRIPLD